MFRLRFPTFVVTGLLVLLGVLAFLQYRWVGQISDGEREQMRRRLESDTQQFAAEFNREMQNAYFNFQIGANVWRTRKWEDFNERYKFWSEKTAYPNLIKNFYFVGLGENQTSLRYDRQAKSFETSELPAQIAGIKTNLSAEGVLIPIAPQIPALLMPVHDGEEKIERFLIRSAQTETATRTAPPALGLAKKYGVLIIELDQDTIKKEVLPALKAKYFSEGDNANYKIAVTDEDRRSVFQTDEVTANDASAKLFDLSAENFIFFSNREMFSSIRGEGSILKRIESPGSQASSDKTPKLPGQNVRSSRVEVQLKTDQNPRIRVFETNTAAENKNPWTLNVQHNAGSLEQFAANTRHKNLGISFGILSLLGASILLIFFSAQRVKATAQRQMDFVSSVSHEFRTPLAVIYSAGENLADGVAKEDVQVARYGNLIKGEGKKISAMVEQILDFAGADSGRKKYDLRETNISEIIENALAECQPLIYEKGIKVEKEITENLLEIIADKTALTQAVQNLIVNSIKYSNGEKFIRVSAQNGGNSIKITVEDRGIGIAKNDLKHIFEPFYRAKAVVDEQIHGNGLGLSLVKQTVEAHGGRIDVESEIAKGSKFTITLDTTRT